MNCDCFTQINEKLKPLNLRLSCSAFVMPYLVHTLTLQTEWIEKDKIPIGRKKLPTPINVSYCPFCGKAVDYPSKCETKSGDTIPVTGVNTSAAGGTVSGQG